MDPTSKVFVAGHRGLVGSAIVRRLQARSELRLVTRTRSELDLCSQSAVQAFFQQERPDVVFLAAAKVGGIQANCTYPADFIRENLQIQTNVIDSACRAGASKLIFFGSSSVYPRLAPQPIQEDALLSGPLEPTNDAYAIAKIAGLKMCQAYRRQFGLSAISLMPSNLYGPGDHFGLETSHVVPALIRKFHDAHRTGASQVVLWGTGTPRRELLHVDDLADAAVFLADTYDDEQMINVGTGTDVTISELAGLVQEAVGYRGLTVFDASKPDGTPRKLMDTAKLRGLGWEPRTGLAEGIASTYQWFLRQSRDGEALCAAHP